MISIIAADFEDARVVEFLESHLADLAPTAPAESRHALDLSALQGAGVQLWVAVDGNHIVGSAALAELVDGRVELKTMRTDPAWRGRGIASQLLTHVLSDARERGKREVLLETGSMDFFAAARALYRKAGFKECPPFGDYREDPNSVFMKLVL